jgi:vancomycin resistance protein YoaR
MKKDEIKVGGTYLAKVSDKVVPVRIDAENVHGGWDATNLRTRKKVRIKSAQRLRCPANRDSSPQAKPEVQAQSEDGKKAPKAKAAKPAKAGAEAKAKKLAAIDAAVKVLGENGQAMNCKEMIEAMAAKGYWTSPGGKTPNATLYAAILREIQTKGKDARFTKTERGKFALAN